MLRLLYSIKFSLANKTGNNYINRQVRAVIYIILSKIANIWALLLFKLAASDYLGVNTTEKREKKVVVSLTTFPARIDTVWISIETILRQTIKPDIIILWLAQSQFNNIEDLPENLLKLQKRGLKIRFCEDLKSHKKYYYTFLEYPDDIIITVDDDIIYPNNTIEVLLNLHQKYPEYICCNRGHLMKKTSDNQIAPYEEWIQNPRNILEPTELLCPTGVSGVLYPPDSVNKEVFNKNNIRNLCFHADDLWLKLMSVRNNTKVVKSNEFPSEFFVIDSSQRESLAQMNVSQNQNDEQFQAVLNKYKIKFTD